MTDGIAARRTWQDPPQARNTPVPSCEDPQRPACLACTDAADRCVPWPCEFAEVSHD